MLDLILIVILIISLAKPDILLAKKVKEKANDEQKDRMAKNNRKIFGILVATIEGAAITRYFPIIGIIISVILIVLLVTISLPAVKENSKIMKELGLK